MLLAIGLGKLATFAVAFCGVGSGGADGATGALFIAVKFADELLLLNGPEEESCACCGCDCGGGGIGGRPDIKFV